MSIESHSSVEHIPTTSINDLPDEVLEYVLSLVPPYKDLQDCMLVCKRWHRTVLSVIHHRKLEFNRAILNFSVKWQSLHESNFPKMSSITKRYSHSACSYGNYMYVFGGCTSTSTTFNDLWKLNLSSRKWDRLLSMGSYPSPKACATLVYYKNSLVLFGGWTHPSPLPLHQAWKTYNELHIYDIDENRWTCIVSPDDPPPTLAGHSATIHGRYMIVFGGLQGITGGAFFRRSNEVWCLDLEELTWSRKETTEEKPTARYGQSQIYIDDHRLIIIGGWGIPPVTVMSDVWMLTMTGRIWTWTELTVTNQQWAASHLWCHPACRIDDYVVVVSRNPVSSLPPLPYNKWSSYTWAFNQHSRSLDPPYRLEREEVVGRVIDRDVNVNGRRGSLGRNPPVVNQPLQLKAQPTLLAFRDNTLPPLNSRRRERQLDTLRKMEEKLKGASRKIRMNSDNQPSHPKMAIFVLDIGCIVGRCTNQCQEDCSKIVRWLPMRSIPGGGPDATILHTLVQGHGELIMFGGVEKDIFTFGSVLFSPQRETPDNVSNSLHFLSPPLSII